MIDVKMGKIMIVVLGMCYVCELGYDVEVLGDEMVEFIEFEIIF